MLSSFSLLGIHWGFLLLCLCITVHFRSRSPSNLSLTTSSFSNLTFHSTHVYDSIQWIANMTRPIGSKANRVVRDRLLHQLKKWVELYPERKLEVLENSGFTIYKKEQIPYPFLGTLLKKEFNQLGNPSEQDANATILLENSNLYFRIPGTKELLYGDRSSLLLSAHFDSVPTSRGVGDNAIAVAVLLEIIRLLLLDAPLEYSLLICFNNGEEALLQGAIELMHFQKLWKDVVTFINLDSMCPTGRPLLFRSSSSTLLRYFAKYSNYPHAHSFGQELIQRQWIHSFTDFSIYSDLGKLPGLDFAFYDFRWAYHTMNDNEQLLQPRSFLHLGDSLWSLIQGIQLEGGLSTLVQQSASNKSTSFIFLDILGHWMFTISSAHFMYLCLGTALIVFWMFTRTNHSWLTSLKSILPSFSFECRLIFVFIVGWIVPWTAMYLNPLIASGYPSLPPFLSFLASSSFLYGYEARQHRFYSTKSFSSHTMYANALAIRVAWFWWGCLFVLAMLALLPTSLLAHTYFIAMIYFVFYFSLNLLSHPYSNWLEIGPWILFLGCGILTFPMVLDITITLLSGMSFTVQEGTPCIALAFLYSLSFLPMHILSLPWMASWSLHHLRCSFRVSCLFLFATWLCTVFLWPHPSLHTLNLPLRFRQYANVDLPFRSATSISFYRSSFNLEPFPFPSSSPSLSHFTSSNLSSSFQLDLPDTSFHVLTDEAYLLLSFNSSYSGGIFRCASDATTSPSMQAFLLPFSSSGSLPFLSSSFFSFVNSRSFSSSTHEIWNTSLPFVYIHSSPTPFQFLFQLLPPFPTTPFLIQCHFAPSELPPHLHSLMNSLLTSLPKHINGFAHPWDHWVSTITIQIRPSQLNRWFQYDWLWTS